ncbi:STAS-like domain-containing protein [Alicyclobacillus tolerans]|uniref:STAS-like domain-containing protein n=1 Tax=Alicyclobacillus tolerans TaxID=90970 RepID=UPI001F473621|nr:STAS-like domain-containing protein [Alicyclobacillus tolerans]MCF8563618.1 STAS-like domain-containing protein [Alicyclobacillus tolerans]
MEYDFSRLGNKENANTETGSGLDSQFLGNRTIRYRVASQLPQSDLKGHGSHWFFLLLWHDLAENNEVELDFSGLDTYEPAFFDPCCRELLRHFQVSFLKHRIHLVNLSAGGMQWIRNCVAKELQL